MGPVNSTRKQWDISSIPGLTGRVAVVTGGNAGLGFVTVRELARKGAHVYMLCRQESRALAAIEKINKAAAEELMKRETRLDILINNAGIMVTPYELTADEIEVQACNGTGHFALTVPLLPLLKQTAATPDPHVRIVNITSNSDPDFSTIEGLNQRTWSARVRYGLSKLANILFTNELQKRLNESGTKNIYCISVHPGGVSTELMRGPIQSWPYLWPVFSFMSMIFLAPEQGALTQLYAATAPEVEEQDLKYLTSKSKLAEDKDGKLGGQFWDLCENLVKEKT
ncbi:NAD(P)-binding protein [Gymnopus androsaceus JB14]|uniref:NAD(P)-binding protein n=1 Tax=Gymnopus androsaceus JB14 TaxID=1447944 RepID=A0A6A4IBI5_9AGAR|nr:NAD(P)-binding protein [Gymnopus androsaceus JB14]